MRLPSNGKAHLALFGVALIYGANYLIAKVALNSGYIEPSAFIFLRVSFATLIFWGIDRYWVRERVARADWAWFALCALFGVAINQLFFFYGLQLTSPINASLLMTTTPILVLLAASVLLKERITALKLSGIGLGAAGAVLLILHGKKFAYQKADALGDVLIFVNATAYAIYLVLVRRLMRRYHFVTVIKWGFTFGWLYVLPVAWNDLGGVQWAAFTPAIWWSIAYVLVFTSFAAYFLNAYALKQVSPAIVSAYIYLQPVLAALFSLWFDQEPLTPVKLLAGSLIFLGVFLVSRPPRKSRALPPSLTKKN